MKRSGQTLTQVDVVKARLNPELDHPYFVHVTRYDKMANKQCDHHEVGAVLDETTRKVHCRKCNAEIDAFDALLAYAAAEKRLVATWNNIDEARRRDEQKVERSKRLKPFVRRVVRATPVKDLAQKAEPVVGYQLTLECTHVVERPEKTPVGNITCHECAKVAGVIDARHLIRS